VQVNPELEEERAIFGAELPAEQFKIVHVAQHDRKAHIPDGQ
jgi:hypothetical protein